MHVYGKRGRERLKRGGGVIMSDMRKVEVTDVGDRVKGKC